MILALILAGCVIDLTGPGDDWQMDDVVSDWTEPGSDTWGYPNAPDAIGELSTRAVVWMSSTSVAMAEDGRDGALDLGGSVCHFESDDGAIDYDFATGADSTVDVGGVTLDRSTVGVVDGRGVIVGRLGGTVRMDLSGVVASDVDGEEIAFLGGSRCTVQLVDEAGQVLSSQPQPEAACSRGGLVRVEGHSYTVDGTQLFVDGVATAVATAASRFDVDPGTGVVALAEGDSVRLVDLASGATLWTRPTDSPVAHVAVGGDPMWVHATGDSGGGWLMVWDLDGVERASGNLGSQGSGYGHPLAVARDTGLVAVGTDAWSTLLMGRP